MVKKMEIAPELAERTKEIASRIYCERAAGRQIRQEAAKNAAIEAFQLAVAFANAEAQFDAEGIPQPVPSGYKPLVKFAHMRLEKDGEWVPVLDDDGNPVVDEMEGDPDAHAPNLPPTHPINVRFTKAREILGLEPVAIGN